MNTIVNYKGQWFGLAEHSSLDLRTIQFFNSVVEVDGSNYSLIKDRRSNQEDIHSSVDLVKMQLFVSGKTLDDLPLFINNPDDKDFPRGPLDLAMDADGNLVTVSAIDEYDPRN